MLKLVHYAKNKFGDSETFQGLKSSFRTFLLLWIVVVNVRMKYHVCAPREKGFLGQNSLDLTCFGHHRIPFPPEKMLTSRLGSSKLRSRPTKLFRATYAQHLARRLRAADPRQGADKHFLGV